MNKTIETKNGIISWDDRGFVRVECKPQAILEIEDAIAFNKARQEVSPEKKHRCLFDIRNLLSASRESRQYAINEETRQITAACANLMGSPFGKILGNMFMRVDKPPYPTKLFTDEDSAIAWLLQF